MKAKTRFMKMFSKMPEKARALLVYRYWVNPVSLNVCALEIRNDTKLGKKMLKDLGFVND